MRKKNILYVVVILFAICLLCQSFTATADATSQNCNITGSIYEFDKDSHYEYSSSTPKSDAKPLGQFQITGNVIIDNAAKQIASYAISSNTVSFSYSFDKTILDVSKEEWHLIDDKSKVVDTVTLKKDILSGALILQTSLDGETWTDDVIKQDIFTENSDLTSPFYTTKYVQQQNGCYFRLIVAYEMEIVTEQNHVLFVDTSKKEYKKIAEVYEFYLHDGTTTSINNSASDVPRKEIGKKINTGKDNGYSGNVDIDKDDPHYGWDIGTFIINGYTREANEKGTPVFLKNVGDKVTLWFRLEENIDCLHGNSALTIFEDSNGYDRDFEVPQTNFGRGTLIIRYTNEQGISETPVIYTNYLAANARTGADTKAILFEEGDYEVSLDYEIQNNPRKLGPISVIPTYTDYKIAFSFSVRNGNCMVFPLDAATGAELPDKAITANGFKLDMAKSKYLTIDVKRSILKAGTDGILTEDVRFNRPAKDGDTYLEEGIYTFTVRNQYVSEPTTKTIYVGTDKYLTALSKTGLAIEELNAKLSQGAEIADDGTIIEPGASEPAPTFTPKPEVTETPPLETLAPPTAQPVPTTPADTEVSTTQAPAIWPFVALGIGIVLICAGVAAFIIIKKRKSSKKASSVDREENSYK